MRRRLVLMSVLALAAVPARAQTARHNVILFVADGLRPGVVTADTAPTIANLLATGVTFANSHALFPTFTTANASAMATGHLLGDTGDFSNTIFAGFAVQAANGSVTPFLENNAVLGEMDAHFNGDYLNAETVLAAARAAGYSTASVGKVGPALIQDHTERTGQQTIIIDDSTGGSTGIPLSTEVSTGLTAAGLPTTTPSRGANGSSGNSTTPGTTVPNTVQQQFFADATTKVVLPLFKQRNKPFAMVYWSRDPDGTQHNQGDSLLSLTPGINGPTSFAAIKNADNNLAQILQALRDQGLSGTTDVIVTSDHGFSTISKQSGTSWAAQQSYSGVPAGFLPKGFVSLDLAHALNQPLFDPDAGNAAVAAGSLPSFGNGLIGDPINPKVVVAANGGSDLIYLPRPAPALLRQVVAFLSSQDYVSGLFVDDRYGSIPGTLPLAAIGLRGTALTPRPTIVVNFASTSLGCSDPTTCGVEIADSGLQQGQGMHGSFSRADTRNIMGAIGPDFRTSFVDNAPASNADLGQTMAYLLNLDLTSPGRLRGRVLREAMPGGNPPAFFAAEVRSLPDDNGHQTVLRGQVAGTTLYFDAAGYPGRTLGIPGPGPGVSVQADD